jgi:hypothetical protein
LHLLRNVKQHKGIRHDSILTGKTVIRIITKWDNSIATNHYILGLHMPKCILFALLNFLNCSTHSSAQTVSGFSQIQNSPYARDDSFAYHWECQSMPRNTPSTCWRIIKGAHSATFIVLNYRYAVDKNHAYIYGTAISNADPSTFTIVLPQCSAPQWNAYYYKFGKDKYRAYCFGEPLEGSDPSSFVAIDEVFALDNSQAYCRKTIIKEADPGKFKVIQANEFATDGKYIYVFSSGFSCEEYQIIDADIKTFSKIKRRMKVGKDTPIYQDKDYWYCSISPSGIKKIRKQH